MTRAAAADSVAAKLYAAEAALDLALIEVADLAALLPRARADAYVAATTGQGAFTGVSGCIASLTEARARLVHTHRSLAALARLMGMETLAAGPVDKPEDQPTPPGKHAIAEQSW